MAEEAVAIGALVLAADVRAHGGAAVAAVFAMRRGRAAPLGRRARPAGCICGRTLRHMTVMSVDACLKPNGDVIDELR